MRAAKAQPGQRLSPLDPSSSEPIYRQIYWRFRHAITDGALRPGQRVPAVRALAKELGLARGTVDTAYSLLSAEGYFQSRGQAGTVVALGLKVRTTPALVQPSDSSGSDISIRPKVSILPFQMALPALDAFPRKIWAQLGARCVRTTRIHDMANPSVYGLDSLRSAIASYLQMARGITCLPRQVFVTSGYRSTLALVSHALLEPGDQVLIEDPGYPPTRQLLEHMHMQIAPVPVDHDGMRVAQGIDAWPHARAAVVTPAHQSPLSVALSLPRRLELLEWATRQQAWVIEDDYDGEYRYISRPLPALKSLDQDGRVLYTGTFSKVLFPGIRLSYLVVPAALVEVFEQASQTFLGGCPELTQAIVATFMSEGHFARHVQRMRKLYGERREAVAKGLKQALGEHISLDAQPGGMHLIMRLTQPQSDRALVERLLQAGLYAEALSDCCIATRSHSGLMLGFANIDSQASAEQLGKRVLALL
ncbi:PLP-dependent aminotransferase family protein [Pseudomonas sichuanensis]|uniref:MocR-like pyridoxine biosynthesis transcription factor PdxR n=1 Tax=Pseudomonas sichuanensis TaxID=2213015 RepID=UPI0024488DB3|nr:PLP-dependent aminotransferase family protein [Pseudomonas sichuanensis]MDH0733738.1 PLP-dependent aminotransferase family protein [Pseudomonas sichuanensis]MDH1585767.1 PLP-dependent aminotransferase family protein [Pseudomonas sichuanensis]MDH1595469.1 PLP-dependent aminotransferase family protein [Pseudomonas sichuanensis]MDH1600796.1 PLP-dependent aminotransferase family protein [Pseudomonas sichuanensis]